MNKNRKVLNKIIKINQRMAKIISKKEQNKTKTKLINSSSWMNDSWFYNFSK